MLVAMQHAIGFPERGMLTIWLGHLLLGMAYATVVVQRAPADAQPAARRSRDGPGRAALAGVLAGHAADDRAGAAVGLPAHLHALARRRRAVGLPLRPGRHDDAARHLLARPPRPQPERQRRRHRHHRRRRDRRRRRQLPGRAQRAPARRRRRGRAAPTPWRDRHEHEHRRAPGLAYLSLAAAMAVVGAYVGFSKALVDRVSDLPARLACASRSPRSRWRRGCAGRPASRRSTRATIACSSSSRSSATSCSRSACCSASARARRLPRA